MIQTIKNAFANKKSEAYVDSAMKILIAVVIGALLLALLWAIFNSTIGPSVNEAVENLFTKAKGVVDGAVGEVYTPGAGA